MGTYVGYLGKPFIPEEQRGEYAQQALKLLYAGGMMAVEEVRLYGERLSLLYPPELDKHGKAKGYYNYLEQDSWECWYLDANEGTFYSGKVGHRAFCRTVLATSVLTHLYSTSFGIVEVDGRVIREHDCIGWINGVLGTRYTNQRATRPDLMQRLLRRENACLHQGLLTFPIEDVL